MFLILQNAVQSAVTALTFPRNRRRRMLRQAINLAKRLVNNVVSKPSVQHVRKTVGSVTNKMQKKWATTLTQEKLRKAKRMYRRGQINSEELAEIVTPLEQDLHALKNVRSIYSVSRRTPRDPVVKQAKATGGSLNRGKRHHSHKCYISPAQRALNKLADGHVTHFAKPGGTCTVQVA